MNDLPLELTRRPAARRRRPRDAAATQRRLLEAAEKEFAAQGFQGARLREIAQRAGVQPALIHHYFVDKEGLYRSMLESALSESSSASWQILEREGEADIRTIIEAFVEHLLAFNAKYHDLIAILRHEARIGAPASGLTHEIMRMRVKPVVDAVLALIERRQQLGELRQDIEPKDMVLTALALCAYPYVERGFLIACMPSGLIVDEATREARKRNIMETLLRYGVL